MTASFSEERTIGPEGVSLLEERIGKLQGLVANEVAIPAQAITLLHQVRSELVSVRQIITEQSTGPDGPLAA
jgi:hypothetical protein